MMRMKVIDGGGAAVVLAVHETVSAEEQPLSENSHHNTAILTGSLNNHSILAFKINLTHCTSIHNVQAVRMCACYIYCIISL